MILQGEHILGSLYWRGGGRGKRGMEYFIFVNRLSTGCIYKGLTSGGGALVQDFTVSTETLLSTHLALGLSPSN